MTTRLLGIGAVVALAAAAPMSAQSLADVARQEEARRATTKSVKSFSNADLKPGEVVSPAAAAAPALAPAASAEPAGCYMSVSQGRCISADEMLARMKQSEQARFEATWRTRAARIRALATRLQADLNAYGTIVADDRRLESEREAAARKLVATTSAMRDQEALWNALEKEAAIAELPRAWLEPAPVFPNTQQ
jgi:hypothetical protein